VGARGVPELERSRGDSLTANVVGVVCALAAEARHLGPTTRRAASVAALSDGTLVAVSGMGLEAAAASSRALIQAGAGALVSWGMAGGLDPGLAAGAILLPTEIVSLEGAVVETATSWRKRVAERIGSRDVITGRLLTSTMAVGSIADKSRLFRETGAAAVDMESLAVAEAARVHQLPFLAVRVIVDSASDALPRAVTAAANDKGHLHVWRLMGALAREPAELAPLIRLAQRYRAANRSLAAVARVGALAPYP
jgi:adenosylhomocysteine nucleosidase